MGDKQRTQQNLEVVRTDAARGLIFVKGSVPGAKNGWLMIKDSVKIAPPEGLPFPGALKNDNEAPVVDEEVVVVAAEIEATEVPVAEVAEVAAPEAEVAAAEAPVETPAVEEAPAADTSEETKEG
jgi:large subunit ribosomal protein L3